MATEIPRERLDEIRARYRVSDVAQRLTRLKRRGNEWNGLCPFHSEKTGSFWVNDVKGFAHCFGCGYHGDIIQVVRDGFGLSFIDAVAMIDGGALPAVDPAKLARAREEEEAADTAALEDARRFWEEAGPIGGTPADRYLCWRQIFVRPPEIRFARIPTWKNPKTGLWNAPRPALILKAENIYGEFVGIQRIYLTEDGGKADMPNPKLTLGRIRAARGAVRFGRPRSDVIATGSSEDALTLYQRYAEMVTVYLSCGESNLPFLNYPPIVRAVTVARQNDEPGRLAANKARAAIRAQGRLDREIAPPPRFKDWNDEARGIEIAKAA